MQGQKSVFRIQNYRARKAPTEDPSERTYHARRTHRKSRAGCLNCKQRRVKCDETKPYCLKCQKHGVECDYTGEPRRPPNKQNIITRFIEHDPQLISVDRLAPSMSLLLVAERMNDLLSLPTAKKPPKPLADAPERLGSVAALQHFHNVTASTISATNAVTDMTLTKMTKLAFETPFLMHAIIAVATTHVCQISPDNSRYRVAEAYHWQQAISQYSKEVASCITQANMDKLYPACMLITVHSFTLKEYNPRDSFVFSDDPTSLNWLFLQGGLRYLLERTNQWLPQSMWFSQFMQVRDDPSFDFEDSRPGRVDLDPDLADLCRITEASTIANNPYLWPLRMLMQFLPLEQKPPSFRKYFNWAGRLEPEYQQCLLQKESPAMILLAWWLALMCCTNLWWLDARVRSECTAICMRLEDSDDPLVLRLLEFPAEQCGYILRHVQEQTCIELETNLTLA